MLLFWEKYIKNEKNKKGLSVAALPGLCLCVINRWSVWWKPEISPRVLSCAGLWMSVTPLYAGWTGDSNRNREKKVAPATRCCRTVMCRKAPTL